MVMIKRYGKMLERRIIVSKYLYDRSSEKPWPHPLTDFTHYWLSSESQNDISCTMTARDRRCRCRSSKTRKRQWRQCVRYIFHRGQHILIHVPRGHCYEITEHHQNLKECHLQESPSWYSYNEAKVCSGDRRLYELKCFRFDYAT